MVHPPPYGISALFGSPGKPKGSQFAISRQENHVAVHVWGKAAVWNFLSEGNVIFKKTWFGIIWDKETTVCGQCLFPFGPVEDEVAKGCQWVRRYCGVGWMTSHPLFPPKKHKKISTFGYLVIFYFSLIHISEFMQYCFYTEITFRIDALHVWSTTC